MTYLHAYFYNPGDLTLEISTFLLFGFLFAGTLRVYFFHQLLHWNMGKSSLAAALNISLVGVPIPLCSRSFILIRTLFRNGASRANRNSFLISTPQTGINLKYFKKNLL
ncbi:MAG: permease [Bacteroidales bacterium]|nr:permease [Bacteroidales bacterium]